MKFKSLFSWTNKKNINLASVEYAQRVIKAKYNSFQLQFSYTCPQNHRKTRFFDRFFRIIIHKINKRSDMISSEC